MALIRNMTEPNRTEHVHWETYNKQSVAVSYGRYGAREATGRPIGVAVTWGRDGANVLVLQLRDGTLVAIPLSVINEIGVL